MQTPPPFELVIGLDRSDRSAELCLIDTRTGTRTHQTLDTAPEVLLLWAEAFHGAPIPTRASRCAWSNRR